MGGAESRRREGGVMADLVQVIAAPGPLPIEATATIESDEPAIVTVAGSVWSADEEYLVGVQLTIDGSVVAKAQIFANPGSTHLAVVPVVFSYTFTIGEHSFGLDGLTGETMTDANDFFLVAVQY
jgi:hypothetical protein